MAAEIVEEARREAETLIRQAREQAAAARLEAYEEGLSRGRDDGLAAIEQRLSGAMELVLIAATEAKQLRDLVLRNTERDAIELVLEVARRVLGELVATDPSLAVDLAERALARAGNQNVLRLRVNPERRQIVSTAFIDRFDASGNPIEVAGDEQIDLGGCIVDLRAGTVDARLDTQIEELSRNLHGLLDEETHVD